MKRLTKTTITDGVRQVNKGVRAIDILNKCGDLEDELANIEKMIDGSISAIIPIIGKNKLPDIWVFNSKGKKVKAVPQGIVHTAVSFVYEDGAAGTAPISGFMKTWAYKRSDLPDKPTKKTK